MADQTPEFDTITALALRLSASEKLRLMERLTVSLQAEIEPAPEDATDNPMLMMHARLPRFWDFSS